MSGSIQGSIRQWKDWWRGYDGAFHRFCENGAGGQVIKRDMYRMNMAKKVCEDWASLLFNDDCTVRISDEVGEAFVRKVFEENDFFGEANKLTEEAFALGTAAAILRLSDFVCEDGKFRAGEKSKISFDYVDAEHIRPISVRNGRIIEAAFVSEEEAEGRADNENTEGDTHRLAVPVLLHPEAEHRKLSGGGGHGSFGFRGRNRLSQGSGPRVQQFLP